VTVEEGRLETAAFCREIETYLCRKNDGHLIRVTGPSFDLVAAWAAQGVPLKVAFGGIDRYFERYYRKGARRRPVRIDFCEADVLDAFDDWRRAVGIAGPLSLEKESGDGTATDDADRRRRESLPAHLERAVTRLTAARVNGRLGSQFDDTIDRVACELDRARANARGLRGEARQALLDRLSALDIELLAVARSALAEADRDAMIQDADEEVIAFRDRMDADRFARVRDLALTRLIRERLGLPVLTFL